MSIHFSSSIMSDNDTKVMEDVNIKAIGTKDKKSFVLFLQLFYKSKKIV